MPKAFLKQERLWSVHSLRFLGKVLPGGKIEPRSLCPWLCCVGSVWRCGSWHWRWGNQFPYPAATTLSASPMRNKRALILLNPWSCSDCVGKLSKQLAESKQSLAASLWCFHQQFSSRSAWGISGHPLWPLSPDTKSPQPPAFLLFHPTPPHLQGKQCLTSVLVDFPTCHFSWDRGGVIPEDRMRPLGPCFIPLGPVIS